MRIAWGICAGLYAGFEENRKPDQPGDPRQILDKREAQGASLIAAFRIIP
jgi:hypothetical protein